MRQNLRSDLDTWTSPVLSNMLWVLLSLPVVTMPIALVGLLATMFHWMDDRRTQVFSIFFRTIRRTWYKAYILFVIDLLIGGFLAFNFLILPNLGRNNPLMWLSLGATLFCSLIFLSANVPAWVLIAVWDAPLKRILTFSVRLVFAQPFWTVGIALVFALIFVISTQLPAIVFVTLTGAVAGYFASWATYRLVGKYVPREDFQFVDIL